MAESFKEHAQSKNVVLGGDRKNRNIYAIEPERSLRCAKMANRVSPVGRGS